MSYSPVWRSPLSEATIERSRRERYRPRPTECAYLYLTGIQQALTDTFRQLPVAEGPALDLFCGTQPYRDMIPRRPVWGLDRDRYFGRADVAGSVPLPFRDGAFSLVLCTQALHMVDDPPATVKEMHRVLAPGGHAVVTVPYLFRREHPAERQYGAAQLRALFAGWAETRVSGFGGVGSALAYYPGSLAGGAARRWPPLRHVLPPVALALNAAGIALEAVLRPLARRWPGSFIVVARRSNS